MTDPDTFRPEQQRRAGRAHATELGVLLPLGMNRGIGFDKRFAQGRNAVLGRLLVIGMGNDADRQLTGELAHRMGAHAIRDNKQMSSLLPLLFVAGQQGRMRVLVMAAPNPYISQARVFNRIVAKHQRLPQAPHFLLLNVCYNGKAALHSG